MRYSEIINEAAKHGDYITLYHGTRVPNIDTLRPTMIETNGTLWGKGVYLTPDRDYAKKYALNGYSYGYIYTVLVPKNATIVDLTLPILAEPNIANRFTPRVEYEGYGKWEMYFDFNHNGNRMSYIGKRDFSSEEEANKAALAYRGLDLVRDIDAYTVCHTLGIDGSKHHDADSGTDSYVMYGEQTVASVEQVSE